VQSWNVLTNAFRSQYVGIIVATWGLFQGASGIQLARQGFGSGKVFFCFLFVVLLFILCVQKGSFLRVPPVLSPLGVGSRLDYARHSRRNRWKFRLVRSFQSFSIWLLNFWFFFSQLPDCDRFQCNSDFDSRALLARGRHHDCSALVLGRLLWQRRS
jgi:hypothetical protein